MSRPLFLRRLRKYVAALPALAFGFMANPAFSVNTVVNINANAITSGSQSASFLGATLTPTSGRSFTKSTTPGTNSSTVIGVSGGSVPNEIDVSGTTKERITLNFGATGAVVSEITLGLLYLKDQTGDLYNEAVQLQTNGGTSCASSATAFCILSASGAYRGTVAANLSPATAGNGGIFRITNPFGAELISLIDIMPWAISGTGADNSDFGLLSVTYTTTAVPIPEPGTLALVGLGMLGLVVAGGHRARS